jgi:hemerythrin-like domain-containing protein
MRAIHQALRRDATRLEAIAPRLEGVERIPAPVEAAWEEFRDELVVHHNAEDDDLWPILRGHLDDPDDLREVDLMVEEHRQLQPAIDTLDQALSRHTEIAPAASGLVDTLRRHLDHEERTIFPLLEQYLSKREWRNFLMTERRRTPLRHRPDFLAWVLDDATEHDAGVVLNELPPPGRVVYRRFIGPRYAATHQWQPEPSAPLSAP